MIRERSKHWFLREATQRMWPDGEGSLPHQERALFPSFPSSQPFWVLPMGGTGLQNLWLI